MVGAGNGDDVPVEELTRRCRRLDLVDIDGGAMFVARRRAHLHRRRVRLSVSDITEGGADRAIRAALSGEDATWSTTPVRGLPGGPYDVVLSDLLYTQLLFPALLDSGLPGHQRASTLAAIGPQITEHVVRRLHASTPHGIVVHLHDLLGWWPGHPQPFTIDEVLRLAEQSPSEALALADSGRTPIGTDPRPALDALGAEIIDTAMWRWPFAEHVDYLVVATVARVAP